MTRNGNRQTSPRRVDDVSSSSRGTSPIPSHQNSSVPNEASKTSNKKQQQNQQDETNNVHHKRPPRSQRGQARNAKPSLNGNDVVEWLPGASAQCTGPERRYFVEESKRMWRTNQAVEKEEQEESERKWQEQFELDIQMLCEMFPILDKSLVVEYYNETQTMEECCERLMEIQAVTEKESDKDGAKQDVTTDVKKETNAESLEEEDGFEIVEPSSSSASPEKEVHKLSENDFPVLRDKDGWEVCNVEALEEMQADTPRKWSEMAKSAKDIPQPACRAEKSPEKPVTKKVLGCQEEPLSADSSGAEDLHKDYDLRRKEGHKKRGKKKFGKRIDKKLGSETETTGPGTGEEDNCRSPKRSSVAAIV